MLTRSMLSRAVLQVTIDVKYTAKGTAKITEVLIKEQVRMGPMDGTCLEGCPGKRTFC